MEAGAATGTGVTGSGTKVSGSGFVGVGVLRLTEKRQMLRAASGGACSGGLGKRPTR